MLTEKTVRALEKPGRYKDEPTLFLVVSPGGTRSWTQRLYVGGKRVERGLGSYPSVGLKEARRLAIENRRTSGRREEPTTRTVPTLAKVCEQYYNEKKSSGRWKPGRAQNEWMGPVEKYILSACGEIPVDQLERHHLINALTPLCRNTPETARKSLGKLRLILGWCRAHGYMQGENLAEVIKPALTMTKKSTSFRAIEYKRIEEVWEALCRGQDTVGRMLVRFLLLTGVRSQEARLAVWDEISWETATWTISAPRMKGHVVHRVPLSYQALAVLEYARRLGSPQYVFPGDIVSRPLGHAAPMKVLKDCGVSGVTTIHGFRSVLRTWGQEETDEQPHILELCLAHQTASETSQRYIRGDALERRRPIMQMWADYVTGRKGVKVRTTNHERP